MKKNEQDIQWSTVIAEHAIGWEDGPEDQAVLLVPRFRKGPLAKWLQPRLKKPHIRVKLDDVGSFVWKRLDGKKAFAEILSEMKIEFGDRIEPAEDRLTQFFRILHKDKFVELYKPSP